MAFCLGGYSPDRANTAASARPCPRRTPRAVQHADTVAGTPAGLAHVGFYFGAASAMGTPRRGGSDQQGAGDGRGGGERRGARDTGAGESRWAECMEPTRLVHRPTGRPADSFRFALSSDPSPAWGVPCLLQASVPPAERHTAFFARARGHPHTAYTPIRIRSSVGALATTHWRDGCCSVTHGAGREGEGRWGTG